VFLQFLSGSDDSGPYRDKLALAVQNNDTRLLISVDDLAKHDQLMRDGLLQEPLLWVPAMEAAVNEVARTFPDGQQQLKKVRYAVGFEGNFGAHRISPRELAAKHLGHLMCVEGIVTQCGLVRPKVQATVHYSEAESAYEEHFYHDETSILGAPTTSVYPTKVPCFGLNDC